MLWHFYCDCWRKYSSKCTDAHINLRTKFNCAYLITAATLELQTFLCTLHTKQTALTERQRPFDILAATFANARANCKSQINLIKCEMWKEYPYEHEYMLRIYTNGDHIHTHTHISKRKKCVLINRLPSIICVRCIFFSFRSLKIMYNNIKNEHSRRSEMGKWWRKQQMNILNQAITTDLSRYFKQTNQDAIAFSAHHR